MIKKRKSVREKILFYDFLVIVPLMILFFIFLVLVVRNNMESLNQSRQEVLEERSENIARSNEEMIRIIYALSVNSEINKVISQREKADGYQEIKNNRIMQNKMQEISELFYNRKYRLMFFGENGNAYLQRSMELGNDAILLEDLKQEDWYQDMKEKDSVSIYFLPRYRSPILSEYFSEDTLFAVQELRNLNTGRKIGILILASDQLMWSSVDGGEEENDGFLQQSFLIDSRGEVINPFRSDMTEEDIANLAGDERLSGHEEGLFSSDVSHKACTVYFSTIAGTDWKLVYYEYRQIPTSFFVVGFVLITLLALAAVGLLAFMNSRFIQSRMKKINENILEVADGNLHARIEGEYETEFQEISTNFNQMLDRIEDLMGLLEQKEKEKYVLEFQSLQSQINSHFLYNTLAAIRFMIQIEEYDKADQSLVAFSKLLRKSFSDSRRIISVNEELDMVNEYLKLMAIRYEDQFTWEIVCKADGDRTAILRNTLQPLVENSISHGFNMKKGTGHILISVEQIQDQIRVEVSDDGVGADIEKIRASIRKKDLHKKSAQFSHIGLSNIQMRIEKNFGSDYGLSADLNEQGGVTFRVLLPVQTFEKEAVET